MIRPYYGPSRLQGARAAGDNVHPAEGRAPLEDMACRCHHRFPPVLTHSAGAGATVDLRTSSVAAVTAFHAAGIQNCVCSAYYYCHKR